MTAGAIARWTFLIFVTAARTADRGDHDETCLDCEAVNIASVCRYVLVKSRERGVVEMVDAVGRLLEVEGEMWRAGVE